MAEEKNFENRIKQYLKQHGAWFVKYWGGGGFTQSGIPDILCCYNGRFLGIEVKATKGRPTALQLETLNRINESGGLGILLYPQDWKMFQHLIDEIDKPLWFKGGATAYFMEVLKQHRKGSL